jgi:hypothetical protein
MRRVPRLLLILLGVSVVVLITASSSGLLASRSEVPPAVSAPGQLDSAVQPVMEEGTALQSPQGVACQESSLESERLQLEPVGGHGCKDCATTLNGCPRISCLPTCCYQCPGSPIIHCI